MVGDLPFGSYEVSDEQAVATALRFVKEAGCDAVKLEGGGASRRARAGDRRGRHPGHGPRRPDAADLDRARRLQGPGPHAPRPRARSPQEALALQEAGCFAIVFEAIPSRRHRGAHVAMEIPVIGIGAGPATDGQVLVFHDLLGIREGARRALRQALRRPAGRDGRGRRAPSPTTCARARYPAPEHAYSIDPGARRLPAALRAERA